MQVRLSRQAVSLSEDVEDHTLVWQFAPGELLGDVVARVVSDRYLPHMHGCAWPFSLVPPAGSGRASMVAAVILQRPLGVTRIVPLDLVRLAVRLDQLERWVDDDGVLGVHCAYSSSGRPLPRAGFARMLRR